MSNTVEVLERSWISRDEKNYFGTIATPDFLSWAIQVLVLIPGVGVQVPPRAPKASISKEIGAFFCLQVSDFGDLKK